MVICRAVRTVSQEFLQVVRRKCIALVGRRFYVYEFKRVFTNVSLLQCLANDLMQVA